MALFRTARRPVNMASVQLCDTNIPLSSSVRCLGITLDEKLNWRTHLEYVTPRCYSVIASLRRLREVGIPVEGLLLAYKGLFLPLLCYGILVWGGGYETVAHKAQKIQNDAIRAMFGRRRRESVCDIFTSFSLLTFKKLYESNVLLFAYKIWNQLVPVEVTVPLSTAAERSGRRHSLFEVPNVNKEISRHALSNRLPRIWGSLPRELRALRPAKLFLRHVKNRLQSS